MPRLISLICVLASLVVFAQPGTQVPVGLLAAAQNSPVEFVMALADASVPAGLEIRASERTPRRKPELNIAPQPTQSIAELVRVFNEFHRDYRAALVDDVLVIRPSDKRSAYLDQQSTIGRPTVTGLFPAIRTVFSSLHPSVNPRGGIVGSTTGVGPEEDFHGSVFTLDGQGHTVIQVLNQIARQTRRAWFVGISNDDSSPRIIEFGIVHRGGWMTKTIVP